MNGWYTIKSIPHIGSLFHIDGRTAHSLTRIFQRKNAVNEQ